MRFVIHSLCVLAVAVGLASCARPTTTPAPTAPAASAAEPGGGAAQLAYNLSQKTWCTNDDACSLVLLFTQGQDSYTDFAARLEKLEAQGLVQSHWNLQADDSVTKGTLAYMLCRALNIRGGLFMHILPNRRYAYREAVYQKLMLRGSENEPLTGPEAIGILGRAARLRHDSTP